MSNYIKDVTGWDVRDYVAALSPKQSGGNEQREEQLRIQFPPIHHSIYATAVVPHPCHITDMNGSILLWYLPNMFMPSFTVIIFRYSSLKDINS